jgi:hypothetical protein
MTFYCVWHDGMHRIWCDVWLHESYHAYRHCRWERLTCQVSALGTRRCCVAISRWQGGKWSVRRGEYACSLPVHSHISHNDPWDDWYRLTVNCIRCTGVQCSQDTYAPDMTWHDMTSYAIVLSTKHWCVAVVLCCAFGCVRRAALSVEANPYCKVCDAMIWHATHTYHRGSPCSFCCFKIILPSFFTHNALWLI